MKDSSILIIEDDPGISRMLQVLMKGEGYKVFSAHTGVLGVSLASANSPSLILLDLGLPDCDGIELLEGGALLTHAPVIVVTARGQEEQKVRALDAGADDYVVKPFSPAELLARVRVILRRSGVRAEEESPEYRFKGLAVNRTTHEVTLDGEEVHLTPHEFQLLCTLVDNRGKALTNRAIQHEVWGHATSDDFKTLRVVMATLRRKLKDRSSQPRFIKTEVGVGYRFLGE